MADTSEFLTFLFTDIEGSTALWERHPSEMEGALARHDELLRAAVEGRGGRVIKSTGDGLHAVFRSPRDGVRAALDGQRALADAEWPDGMELRVRMGVHAGEATGREGDWFGTEVNRAARVMAVAHGGQVVCTRIVEELVRSDDFDLVDLGEHRLRDLQSTVHLYQVEVPGAPAVHPPLRSVDAHLTNLPYELSSFVGRERELEEVAARLHQSRLVTIVGVGGVGKTRLAVQVGGAVLPDHPDGVWLCELAAVDDPDDLHDAIGASLRYMPPPGVSMVTGLQQHLEHKRVLLVLDNCEHLVGAVTAFVTDTMARAAAVSVLVTSREALGVRGEQIFPLPSLELPVGSEAEAVLGSEAGALFVSRAREARGELTLDERTSAAIHSLCVRLDGIPLAIELAAAQTALMTPAEIERRIDRQFRSAKGGRRGALERHQTLRAAIDWSYELLTPPAQTLLERLSVCVGGFDLEAAIALAAGIESSDADGFDLVTELVAKSLIERYEVNANTRYRLLEMIRQYASERLHATGEADATRDLHAENYAARLVQLAHGVSSDVEYEALDLIEIETPNIAAGLDWWMSTNRVGDVLRCFDEMPFFDYFAAPALTLDELTPIARAAIESEGAELLPGFSDACMFVIFDAFIVGDMDDYRTLTARIGEAGESVAFSVAESIVAMFTGDVRIAAVRAARAAELARKESVQLLIWALANASTMESVAEKAPGADAVPRAADRADEALALARSVPGTVPLLYPLLSVANCILIPDELDLGNVSPRALAHGLAAANEVQHLDRTQRRFWSTTVSSSATHAQAAIGDVGTQLGEWRNLLAEYRDQDQRFMFLMLLGSVCENLARIESDLALEFAAIAESGAIAPSAAFTVYPSVIRRATDDPDAAEAARARAAQMTRDEAFDYMFVQLDMLLAARDGQGA